jgi:plastocyanin
VLKYIYWKSIPVATLIITILVLGACSSSTATTTTSTTPKTTLPTTTQPSSTTAPQTSVTVDLVAQSMSFDKNTITVPAGAKVTVNFNNKDSGIAHNFAAYTDSSATKSIFVGQVISGPKTTTYTFTAPGTPGNYFFRCDIHPSIMTGTLIVQ